MEELIWVFVALLILAAVRNQVAFNIRQAALRVVSAKANAAIDAGDHNWQRFYDQFEKRTYTEVMFDLTAWTPRQAYPRLYD